MGNLRIGFDLLGFLSFVVGLFLAVAGGAILALVGTAFGVFWIILAAAAESDEKKISLAVQEIKSRLEALEKKSADGQ